MVLSLEKRLVVSSLEMRLQLQLEHLLPAYKSVNFGVEKRLRGDFLQREQGVPPPHRKVDAMLPGKGN